MTTNAPKLFAPKLRVVWPADNDGDDPKEIEVQTTNQDLVLWDRTRATHKWPNFSDAIFLWWSFCAWAAMRRQGLIPVEMKYEEFEKVALSVEMADAPVPADPTNAGPDPA